MRPTTTTLAALALSMFLVRAAAADPVPPAYCADQPAGGLDETDVTFRLLASDDCYGVEGGNPNASGSDTSTWTVNTLDGGLFGGAWESFVKDEGADGALNYLGINWTLSAPQNLTTGAWTLSLADPAPSNLPVAVDMLVILKASNRWAGYLFDAEPFVTTGSNSGTFKIAFQSNGGSTPGLSNMSVYFREVPERVPEPASLTLLGSGLGLLVAFGYRRKRAVPPANS